MNNCTVCDGCFRSDNPDKIICDGVCRQSFHAECANFSKNALLCYREMPNLQWFCDACIIQTRSSNVSSSLFSKSNSTVVIPTSSPSYEQRSLIAVKRKHKHNGKPKNGSVFLVSRSPNAKLVFRKTDNSTSGSSSVNEMQTENRISKSPCANGSNHPKTSVIAQSNVAQLEPQNSSAGVTETLKEILELQNPTANSESFAEVLTKSSVTETAPVVVKSSKVQPENDLGQSKHTVSSPSKTHKIVYVSKFHPSVTETEVIDYLLEQSVIESAEEVSCKKLISPYENMDFVSFVSFKVTFLAGNMLASITAVPYRVAHLAGLVLGQKVLPTFGPFQSMESNRKGQFIHNEYHPLPGVYTAKELVSGALPLLESVVLSLGNDSPGGPVARKVLVDGLAASLATSGRESTFPLSYTATDTSRRELAWQADKIGRSIVRFVRENIKTEDADPSLKIYSQCDGHLWTQGTASLLLGPRSSGDLMQLYNEWLHRMILLRDALLPFENFEEVPILIAPSNTRGLRVFEEPRKVFLLECLTGIISQSAIVDAAKALTAPQLPRGGYGLQYSQGLILPAFLSGSNSLHLLKYHPVRLDDSATDLLFDYEHPVYYHAPRHELPEAEQQIPPGVWPPPSLMTLNPRVTNSSIGFNVGRDSSRRVLQLQLEIDTGISVSVDLGQIARGRRYAYRSPEKKPSEPKSNGVGTNGTNGTNGHGHTNGNQRPITPESAPPQRDSLPTPPLDACDNPSRGFTSSAALLHATAQTLAHPGLVTASKPKKGQNLAKNPVHVFPAKDPLIGLALLGKLYPENVILLDEDEDPEAAQKIGKGFGARFVVLQAGKSSRVNIAGGQTL